MLKNRELAIGNDKMILDLAFEKLFENSLRAYQTLLPLCLRF
jgi:hypothetical protein